jgi:SAM-dependent methyltransferase
MKSQKIKELNKISNKDERVVKAFGEEWERFSQEAMDNSEREDIFNDYFKIFPWTTLEKNSCGADIGCGSGRWAAVVAPKVGNLFCVDASIEALNVAKRNLAKFSNVKFLHSDVDSLPFQEEELDFAYSLGVLHHVPDTADAIAKVSRVLKKGAPLLMYLYYAFDNRPLWFKMIWATSDLLRKSICRLPSIFRFFICDLLALFIYYPIARCVKLIKIIGFEARQWPLYYYWDKSFYVMRTDALDRFGTRLEHRFTRQQITQMLEAAGFVEIYFSTSEPFWCVVARKG